MPSLSTKHTALWKAAIYLKIQSKAIRSQINSLTFFDFLPRSKQPPRLLTSRLLKVLHYWVHQTLNRFSTPNYTEKTLTPVPNSREGCDCTHNTAMHKLNLLILLHVMWNVIFPEIFTRRHKFWETTQLYHFKKSEYEAAHLVCAKLTNHKV